MSKWIALFSQTGSELASVCEKMGRFPDMIYCDGVIRHIHSDLMPYTNFLPKEDINRLLETDHKNDIVTLHGYLKIIPEKSICKEMYNLHPGDIIQHPELKGIHPQAKAIELGLTTTGCLIHRVEPGVDEGMPFVFMAHKIKEGTTTETLIEELRHLAINMWMIFLKGRI
tara:strand:- start:6755 stop:7264 length:510 start_codon:yes stop_codon:yes gene_type:complete